MKTEWPVEVTSQQQTATEELIRRLHAKYPDRILSTTLFGSVARGDFTADSDIDLLIVADTVDADFEWDVWGNGSRVSLEFDVIFDLHVYSRAHWESLREKRRTLWKNVEQDGVELKLQPAPA